MICRSCYPRFVWRQMLHFIRGYIHGKTEEEKEEEENLWLSKHNWPHEREKDLRRHKYKAEISLRCNQAEQISSHHEELSYGMNEMTRTVSRLRGTLFFGWILHFFSFLKIIKSKLQAISLIVGLSNCLCDTWGKPLNVKTHIVAHKKFPRKS